MPEDRHTFYSTWDAYCITLIAGLNNVFSLSRKGHRIVNGNFLPTDWTYLGEVRIHPDDDEIAIFPCELFTGKGNNANKFCFHYVSRSVIGTTNTTAKFCMPATVEGNKRHSNDIGETLLLFFCPFRASQSF